MTCVRDCRDGGDCTRSDCKFLHPKNPASKAAAAVAGASKTSKGAAAGAAADTAASFGAVAFLQGKAAHGGAMALSKTEAQSSTP